jgi:hypothetical protein
MIIGAFVKDPNSTIDFAVDWAEWLSSGDTVSSSSWEVPTGLTVSSASVANNVTRSFLTGGLAGVDYMITNRVTTQGGRIEDRSILVQVRQL